jgi:hypothetical protein
LIFLRTLTVVDMGLGFAKPQWLLNDLWKAALEAGRSVGPNGDGLEIWNQFVIDQELGEKNGHALESWEKEQPKSVLSELQDGEGRQHFLYQVTRIPKECPANKLRMAQVAYNLGQLAGTGEGCPYSTDVWIYVQE